VREPLWAELDPPVPARNQDKDPVVSPHRQQVGQAAPSCVLAVVVVVVFQHLGYDGGLVNVLAVAVCLDAFRDSVRVLSDING